LKSDTITVVVHWLCCRCWRGRFKGWAAAGCGRRESLTSIILPRHHLLLS